MIQQFHFWVFIQKTKNTNSKRYMQKKKDTCTPMFTAALFIIAKTWKQPKYPLTDEWIKM